MIAFPSYKTPVTILHLIQIPSMPLLAFLFLFARWRRHFLVELFPFMMNVAYIAWFIRFIVNRVSYALCDRRCLFKYLLFVLIYNIVNSNNLSFTVHGNMKSLIQKVFQIKYLVSLIG